MKKFVVRALILSGTLVCSLLFAGGARFLLQIENNMDFYRDKQTNLYWAKEYATGKTCQQAFSYCEELNYGGFTDWRLPNVNELVGLINTGKSDPATDLPNTPSDWFWSSSSTAVLGNYKWIVLFDVGHGRASNDYKGNGHYVRCVRP